MYKKYRTPACKTCPARDLCTGRKSGGREIERSEYAHAVEANLKNLQENKELYKRRQMIIEHIFGTVKRKWGFNFTDLRGLPKVNGEFALIMTVYNLKRTINILGPLNLINKIKSWKPDYKKVSLASKSSLLDLIEGFFNDFSPDLKVSKTTHGLNSIQFSDYGISLYASKTGFFPKSKSFFTA